MSDLAKQIKSEIDRTKIELIIRNKNDGWWNKFMEKKLKELNQKLKELNNDNDRILDKED